MKKCTKCKRTLASCNFTSNCKSSDGLEYSCKDCRREERKKYNQSKRGLLVAMYKRQMIRSKERKHKLPTYSRESFIKTFITDKNFINLHKNWCENNCQKDLIPSIDRIDNNEGYSYNNIRLVTWKENFNNAVKDGLIFPKRKIKIVDKNTGDTKIFDSVTKASKYTGLTVSTVSASCVADKAGYKCKYVE